MTGSELERLKAEALRGDYLSMARLARALYERGHDVHEVIRRCYGEPFPEEFFVVAEAEPPKLDLPVDFTDQPWRLAIPIERGGPPPDPDTVTEEIERRAFALAPGFLPLMVLIDSDAQHGDSLIGYHLDELKAGRSTIFGIKDKDKEDFDDDAKPAQYGDSLLTVLHEHLSDRLRMLEWQLKQPSNRGFGSIDESFVTEAQGWVKRVEDLQRKAASRTR